MKIATLALLLVLLPACETQQQTEAAWGAGIGAVLGKAVGGSTKDAALGAAVVGGIAWAASDSDDDSPVEQPATAIDTGPFAGTRWMAVDLAGSEIPPYDSFAVHFQEGGIVETTRTTDGETVRATEEYRVVGKTLVIKHQGGVAQASFLIEGDKLIVDAGEKFHGVLQKL